MFGVTVVFVAAVWLVGNHEDVGHLVWWNRGKSWSVWQHRNFFSELERGFKISSLLSEFHLCRLNTSSNFFFCNYNFLCFSLTHTFSLLCDREILQDVKSHATTRGARELREVRFFNGCVILVPFDQHTHAFTHAQYFSKTTHQAQIALSKWFIPDKSYFAKTPLNQVCELIRPGLGYDWPLTCMFHNIFSILVLSQN